MKIFFFINNFMIGRESKHIASFLAVGLFTTFLMYVLWNFFIYLSNYQGLINEQKSISVSYFLAAFLVIGVSLYLNRKITFKHRQRRYLKKTTTIIQFYFIYTFGALIGALVVYLLQIILRSVNIEIIKILSLGINVMINYLGQRLWIFK